MGRYTALSRRLTGFVSSVRNRPFNSSTISGGASVIDRIAAANMANVFVYASGMNSRPACPVSVKIGRKLTVISSSEKKIGRPTSLHASTMIRLPIGPRRRCRQAHVRILDQHDRRVRQLADRDGDAAERHDVRGQARDSGCAMNDNSTDSGSTTITTSAERAWNRKTRQMIVTMTACWISVFFRVSIEPEDQLRPVVGRNQVHAFGQPQRRDLAARRARSPAARWSRSASRRCRRRLRPVPLKSAAPRRISGP